MVARGCIPLSCFPPSRLFLGVGVESIPTNIVLLLSGEGMGGMSGHPRVYSTGPTAGEVFVGGSDVGLCLGPWTGAS